MTTFLMLYSVGIVFTFALLVFPPFEQGRAAQGTWWPRFEGRRLWMWTLILWSSILWPVTAVLSVVLATSQAEWYE